MPDNRQVKSNAVANQSADNIEEAIWRLKIHDNQEGGGVAQASPYPARPGEPDCLFYRRTGLCGYGSNCRFNHPAYAAQGAQYREELPERNGQPDCGYYLKTGTCKYGSTCKYHHPKDRNGAGPVSFNILGLPMRQDEKSCPYYMRTGSCKFGVACKFHHPQPSSLGTALPLTGNASLGSMGSSVLPSSGLQYAGSLPTWSLQRAPYLSSRLQGTQSYMPLIVSPSQGIVPAPGWNTYMGNIGPLSPTSIAGSNLIYSSRNQGDLGAGAQMHILSASSQNFPERPDQPDCRYYMNTGTCKYGADCKFHHPKERIAQSAASNIGPLGLPSRPGQAICSNYSMYGICKFGPTCRFDHPYAGYPINYGLSLPPLSILDSSLMNHQAISATHSIETSPDASSKIPNWVQNSDAASVQHQNPDMKNSTTKNSDDSSKVDHPPHSVPNCSEPPHDQSN